jgi:hypothetical protein
MPYYSDSELKSNRRAQDRVLADRHRGFDLAAQDITPKYHRPHFAVVGEGTREARTAYERGYAAIDWRQ